MGLAQNLQHLPKNSKMAVKEGDKTPTFWARPLGLALPKNPTKN
jgi:hypothetical protein